jgi:bifunctional non-homologous end joining protein LigD
MPFIQPMPLGRKPEPFDYPGWIYELKYDGFRALAVVDYGRCTLSPVMGIRSRHSRN